MANDPVSDALAGAKAFLKQHPADMSKAAPPNPAAAKSGVSQSKPSYSQAYDARKEAHDVGSEVKSAQEEKAKGWKALEQ